MQLYEVKESECMLLQCSSELPWPDDVDESEKDMFDWLGAIFGFQQDNIRNQREHVISLLSNEISRRTQAFDGLCEALFKNYKNWSTFVVNKEDMLSVAGVMRQQWKLICIGLYLLIWGEAATLRFMPECICYLFHNMIGEVHSLLVKDRKPSCARDEAYLREVVAPIYCAVEKEAKKHSTGKAAHSDWSNYDDFNEKFWTPDCFSLGWSPMGVDGDPFKPKSDMAQEVRSTVKSNFTEARTFFHIFHSFDRLWTFYILAFQAMLILAFKGVELSELLPEDVLYHLSSVVITAAVLHFLQCVLDVFMNFRRCRTWKFTDVLRSRIFFKTIVSLVWCLFLPICYAVRKSN